MDNYLFECTECEETYSTLGALHAHVEGHLPVTKWFGDTDKLMEYTRVLKVKETEEVDIEDVDVPTRNGFIDYMTGIMGLKS